MKTIHLFQRVWRRWLALSLVVAMTACATGPKVVSHAFSFDGNYDKWANSVDLLAYAYGDQYHMVRNDVANPRSPVFAGLSKLPPGTGINGPMPVGDFLQVKWRLHSTGEVLEERVDLRGRLPKDMTDHELTFVIDGRQLYVFVVTPRRKNSSDEPPVLKTWRSQYSYAYEIFPTLRNP
jgi:hypothetical protein